MVATDSAFTYDDIHEIFRNEKNSADLEELDEATIENIKSYFRAKKALLAKQEEEGTFSSNKQRKQIESEIENAKMVIKDLYEIREKKVMNRALYTVRAESKVKDTTNMLPQEEELYNFLLEELASKRKSFFESFSRVRPKLEKDEAETETHEEEPQKISTIKLQFLESVPLLMDSKMTEYGPFEKDDEAELPEELASVLVKQSKASKC